MKPKLLLFLALVLSGGLLGCSTTARHHAALVSVPQIKIAFAKRQVAPLVDLPKDVQYPSDMDSYEHGALTNIVAGHIAALNVIWADPMRFKTESQTRGFLRELLSSTNELIWTYHAWSYGDIVPSLVATVEHTKGNQGKWIIWNSPNIAWAYQDGNGKWWWGMWDSLKPPKPKSLNTP